VLEALASVLGAVLDYAPPILLAALGGVLSERSGVVNIGLEGMMRFGAFFAIAGGLWTGSPWMGVGAAMLAGAVAGLLHAYVSIRWRADQVVSGVALNLLALGSVTFLLEASFNTVGTSPPVEHKLATVLAGVPVLGGHSVLTWVAVVLPFAMHFFLERTVGGLRVRAVGEHPRAAATLGISVTRVRYLCVVGSGALAGLGGAALSLALLGHFDNHMPSGQGFMALAAMVFGKWTPLGAAAAAVFFAAADALQITLTSSLPGITEVIPKGFFLALPYLLTLLVLAGFVGRARPPAADGVPYDPEGR